MANNGNPSGHGSGQPPSQPPRPTTSQPNSSQPQSSARPLTQLQLHPYPPQQFQPSQPNTPVIRPIPQRPAQLSGGPPSGLPQHSGSQLQPSQAQTHYPPPRQQQTLSQPPGGNTYSGPQGNQSLPQQAFFRPLQFGPISNSNTAPPLLQPIPQRPQQQSQLLGTHPSASQGPQPFNYSQPPSFPPYLVPNTNSNNPPPLSQPLPLRPQPQLSSLLGGNTSTHQGSHGSQPPSLSTQPIPPSTTGQPRARSPGGTVYEREPSPPNSKKRKRRDAAGYDNPSHEHSNMIPLWRKAAVSPPPPNATPGSKAEKDWLMDKNRRFQTRSPGGSDTGIIKGHGKGVLGHLPDASSHWNASGHKHSRKKNFEHNRETSTYHGIEERQHSNASGHLAPRYSSPTPGQGSHPSHWNPLHPDFDPRSPWHTWRPVQNNTLQPSSQQPPTQSQSSQSNHGSQPLIPLPSVQTQARPQLPTGIPSRPQQPPLQGFQFQPPPLNLLSPQVGTHNTQTSAQPLGQPFIFGAHSQQQPQQQLTPMGSLSLPVQQHGSLGTHSNPFSVPVPQILSTLQPSHPPQTQQRASLVPPSLPSPQIPQHGSSQQQPPQLPSFSSLFAPLVQQTHQQGTQTQPLLAPLLTPQTHGAHFQPPLPQHNPPPQQPPGFGLPQNPFQPNNNKGPHQH